MREAVIELLGMDVDSKVVQCVNTGLAATIACRWAGVRRPMDGRIVSNGALKGNPRSVPLHQAAPRRCVRQTASI